MTSPRCRALCLRLAALSATALIALSGCTPTYNWREIRPERLQGAGLQLLFPCRPDVAERQVSLAGTNVKLTLHSCQAGGLTWGLSYADVGEPGRVGDALAALQTAATRNLGAAAVDVVGQAVPGSTPQVRSGRMHLRGRLPDGAPVGMDVLFFAQGTWVLQASAIGEAGPPEAIETFMASIRLLR